MVHTATGDSLQPFGYLYSQKYGWYQGYHRPPALHRVWPAQKTIRISVLGPTLVHDHQDIWAQLWGQIATTPHSVIVINSSW